MIRALGGFFRSDPFQRTGRRYLLRHIPQTLLMILGIAIGVAVVVAMDLANASADRAFRLSTEVVTGKATHQISAGGQGVPEELFETLMKSGLVQAAAPVISVYVSSPELDRLPFLLLGIDPFKESPFRNYLDGGENLRTDQLSLFLTQPGAILMSTDLAGRFGLNLGDPFTLEVNGQVRDVFLVGLIEPEDSLSRRSLSGLLMADIATAQELTGRAGWLDRIDLILPGSQAGSVQAQIEAMLPAGAAIIPVTNQDSVLQQMARAFQINLTALSLLALLVGLFLIYNTMTFSVVRRRTLFGTLRCLGATREEIFRMILREAFEVGVVGSVFGILLGILLGRGTVQMVMQTINDLYFTSTIRDLGISTASLGKGLLIGVVATMLAAIPPAWEAAFTPAQAALSRSGLETKSRRAVTRSALVGLGLIGLGAGVFLIPTDNLILGFGGTLAVVIGFALLSAGSLVVFMKAILPLTGRIAGMLGRMAPRDLVNSLSRTSVAVAALMVSVAVTVGVSLMIASFRTTVVTWLEQTLQGDVYISVPSFSATTPSAPIDGEAIAALSVWPGVKRADLLNQATVNSPNGPVIVSATNNRQTGQERFYKTRMGSNQETWRLLEQGGVIVSEPLANRLNLPASGAVISLETPQGPRDFPVLGIYFDYTSSQGALIMALDVYQDLWKDPRVTAVSIRLEDGYDPEIVARELQDELTGVQQLDIRSNQGLRADVMEVFDRTFAITGALQILATVVAFIGVLNSLLLLQLEKQREIGILRSIGLTGRQLWGLVMLETGLMGLTAGLLAIPTGYVLSLILVYIINLRSFGWTLQLATTPAPFLQALGVALLAAVLAGLYPARRLSRMQAAEAVRYE